MPQMIVLTMASVDLAICGIGRSSKAFFSLPLVDESFHS